MELRWSPRVQGQKTIPLLRSYTVGLGVTVYRNLSCTMSVFVRLPSQKTVVPSNHPSSDTVPSEESRRVSGVLGGRSEWESLTTTPRPEDTTPVPHSPGSLPLLVSLPFSSFHTLSSRCQFPPDSRFPLVTMC